MGNIVFVLLRRLQTPLIVLISAYAVSVLGFVLIPGVDDQGQPYRMDFFHAFYFVSFMGSTIGFGELPYAFTPGQRAWTTVTLYSTVFAWLYGIGALLHAMQDRALRALFTASAFERAIKRITEPFYLVCGYGDTGGMLVKALTEAGVRCVVLDVSEERITALELEDLLLPVPGLCADASIPEFLTMAGLRRSNCAGIVALTNNDHVNLTVAITGKLLNPAIRVICRAETHDAEANIASFGTEHIINPFDTFAGRLSLAVHSPSMFLLYEWLTSVPHETLREPLFPPRGKWVLCGYGRFGKAVYERLQREGIAVEIIEADPDRTAVPAGAVIGRGTEADTLQQAGIRDAVGVVAGTDDDANNLSIIMTARQLNPDLFLVARQNRRENDALFQAANIQLTMQRGSIIAHKIFTLIITPLIGRFLDMAVRESDQWANEMISRMSGVSDEQAPRIWALNINQEQAPALDEALHAGREVCVSDLYHHPREREEMLPFFVLMIRRGKEGILDPADDAPLMPGDQLLLCGDSSVPRKLEWTVSDPNVLRYIVTGEARHRGGRLGWA